jgi:hypothetical protein
MMKILAIEKLGLHKVDIWVEDGDQYKNLIVNDADEVDEITSTPIARYRNYGHFVGVMGKFNPYTIFMEKPVEVKGLDFEDLIDTWNKFEKDQRAWLKSLPSLQELE